MVTNSLRLYAEDILARLGLTATFQWILSGQEIERGKPDPAIYRLAADRFGVTPKQMMVLEDSEHGCVAAVGAGATVVVVPNEHNQTAEFEGAHLRANDLGDRRIVAMLELYRVCLWTRCVLIPVDEQTLVIPKPLEGETLHDRRAGNMVTPSSWEIWVGGHLRLCSC